MARKHTKLSAVALALVVLGMLMATTWHRLDARETVVENADTPADIYVDVSVSQRDDGALDMEVSVEADDTESTQVRIRMDDTEVTEVETRPAAAQPGRGDNPATPTRRRVKVRARRDRNGEVQVKLPIKAVVPSMEVQ